MIWYQMLVKFHRITARALKVEDRSWGKKLIIPIKSLLWSNGCMLLLSTYPPSHTHTHLTPVTPAFIASFLWLIWKHSFLILPPALSQCFPSSHPVSLVARLNSNLLCWHHIKEKYISMVYQSNSYYKTWQLDNKRLTKAFKYQCGLLCVKTMNG